MIVIRTPVKLVSMTRKRRVTITDNWPAQCTTRKSQTTLKDTIIKARHKLNDCQTSMKAQKLLPLSHTHTHAINNSTVPQP